MPVEVRYCEVEWYNIASDVGKKISSLQATWRDSERDYSVEENAKHVNELYLPALELLNQFCKLEIKT